jgi:hypothetical protein
LTVEELKSAEIVTHFINVGAIEFADIDINTGQMLYYMNEKMQYVHPKLYYYVKEGFLDGQIIYK